MRVGDYGAFLHLRPTHSPAIIVKKVDIELFYQRLRSTNPRPETELVYESPFQLLIAVILSAQATDVSVNKATRQLFLVAPTCVRRPSLLAGGDRAAESVSSSRSLSKNVPRSPWRSALRKSPPFSVACAWLGKMPVAGVDGTLKKRLTDSAE